MLFKCINQERAGLIHFKNAQTDYILGRIMGQHPTEQLRYGRIQNVNPKTIVKGFKMGPSTHVGNAQTL